MTTEVYAPEILAEVLEEDDMPTFEHGIIGTNISAELYSFLKGKSLGRATASSAEYRFKNKAKNNRKLERQPDIAFVRQEHLPTRFRSYPDFAPDMAIEIVSPNDKTYETEARIQDYQQAGVRLVWIVNPFSRTVDVYRLKEGVKLQRFVEGENLDGEEILPGFKLLVNTIFDYPADPDPTPDPKAEV